MNAAVKPLYFCAFSRENYFRVKKMSNIKKDGIVFAAGAVGYTLLEVLWRGHSHWSMAAAGGISLLLLSKVFRKLTAAPIYFKSIIGGGIITVIELCFGAVFNLGLGMHVWDYSGVRGNILGQICPVYTVLWCLICAPVSYFQKKIEEGKFAKKALP